MFEVQASGLPHVLELWLEISMGIVPVNKDGINLATTCVRGIAVCKIVAFVFGAIMRSVIALLVVT